MIPLTHFEKEQFFINFNVNFTIALMPVIFFFAQFASITVEPESFAFTIPFFWLIQLPYFPLLFFFNIT